ncbi:MAG TPA: OB-fold domain-containing protein [Alphaproteobacteria bacterium]|nr:OB-fold domain-containing protein [Alphaproteobacteria bacterium]
MSDVSGGGLADWTQGTPAIVYQRCSGCGRVWYFRRSFCPRCGAERVEDRLASGRGIVHAATMVHKAPVAALAAAAPYLVILVDAEEGFRLMAHGEPELAIGDAVEAGFSHLAGRLIPYFRRRG